MNSQIETGTSGKSAAGDALYAMSDEQILEMEPEGKVVSGQSPAVSEEPASSGLARPEDSRGAPPGDTATQPRADEPRFAPTQVTAPTQSAVPPGSSEQAPPKWLAERMADPQSGGEAKTFWEGAQKAQQEAAAYREVFAKPEEARAAAERSRQLAQIDQFYFGSASAKPEEVASAREQLAQTLLREDPAAFREMVFAGLRALEKAGVAPPFRAASSQNDTSGQAQDAGLKPGATQAAHEAEVASQDSRLASYAAFEKAANEELDRDVGGAIARTLEQALPNSGRPESAPVRERMGMTIRADIESALKNDRQLAEQVAQVLGGRRFDDTARTQVVRLIGERARQLVPAAAKRVLSDWTQSALAAHRARTSKADSSANRVDLSPAEGGREISRLRGDESYRPSARNDGKGQRSAPVDYRKLSDDQILDL